MCGCRLAIVTINLYHGQAKIYADEDYCEKWEYNYIDEHYLIVCGRYYTHEYWLKVIGFAL